MEDHHNAHDPAEDLVFGAADPYLLSDEMDEELANEELDPSLEGFGDDYFAGQDDDDSLDDDDFDDEDEEDDGLDDEDEEDDFEGDEEEPEAGDDEEEAELGSTRRRRRVARRNNRQAARQEDRAQALEARARKNRRRARQMDPDRKRHRKHKKDESPAHHREKVARRKMTPEYLMAKGYSKSPLSGSAKTTTKGKDTITIDIESNFLTDALTMKGSATGSVVYTVWLGEHPVWRSTAGTPCSVFAINSLALQGNIGGHLLKPGQKIKVDIETAADGDTVRATFIGWKKTHASVC
jgi:hypothetical protein